METSIKDKYNMRLYLTPNNFNVTMFMPHVSNMISYKDIPSVCYLDP